MKVVLAFILTFINLIPCKSQTVDTIRVFNYKTAPDSWRLKLVDKHRFELLPNFTGSKDKIIFSGNYQTRDTTIQFLCDTSNLKNISLLSASFKIYSNIPFIGQGQVFTKRQNYFIPFNIVFPAKDAIHIPKGLYAKYGRGEGMCGHVLEIRRDHSYKFTQYTCTDHSSEQGIWIRTNNVITLFPPKKEWTMLDWVTSNNQFYVESNFLVGKKILQTGETTITETYYYLSKQSLQ